MGEEGTGSKYPWMAILGVFAVIAFGVTGYTITLKAGNNTKEESSFSDAQKEELGDLIYEYLMENPGIIVEATRKYQTNRLEEERKAAVRNIDNYRDFLYNDADTPVVGNPDSDIVVVEFFDYNCGYCKRALGSVTTLVDQDKNVRIVFKEMPILSSSSRLAAKWALASHKQGKYWEYHKALMKHTGNKTTGVLESLAKSVGLDVEKLRKDAQDPAFEAIIVKNLSVARALGIRGTPAFIINDEISRGYLELGVMKDIIDDIRSDG